MSPETLTSYLHRNIPLTAAMRLTALESSPQQIRLRCPLDPNINHHQTAFGGSLVSSMVLAGWAMLRIRMGASGLLDKTALVSNEPLALQANAPLASDAEEPPATGIQLVVSRTTTEFIAPVTTDFVAECTFNEEVQWQRFLERFQTSNWAKLRLQSTVTGEDQAPLARLKGTFIAINGGGPAERLARESN